MRPVFGFTGPRKPILGSEFVGVVDAVGAGVRRFKVGDAVCGFPGFGLGSHAEYRLMPEGGCLVAQPAGLSAAEAASLFFGGTTALYFLRDLARIRAGETLLVVGPLGAVGSAAVQLAKHWGMRVAGLTSAGNQSAALSLGCEEAFDYRQPDSLAGRQFDVVFESVGAGGYEAYRSILNPSARLLLAVATLPQMLEAARRSKRGAHEIRVGTTPERLEDVELLAQLVSESAYRPLVDRVFPLDRVAEAHAYVDTGRKRGNVVLDMEGV